MIKKINVGEFTALLRETVVKNYWNPQKFYKQSKNMV